MMECHKVAANGNRAEFGMESMWPPDGDRVHIGFHGSSKVTCLLPRVPAAEHLIPLSHLLNNTPQVTLDTQYITITFKITLIT